MQATSSPVNVYVAFPGWQMGGFDGISVLRSVKESHAMTEVIVMTAYGTIESAVEAMRLGAFDYIQKPFTEQELLVKIAKAVDNRRLAGEVAFLASEFKDRYKFENIIGRSRVIREMLGRIVRIAPTDAIVLITGESGTGKELVAKAIHANSKRGDRMFVPVNCAAITDTLLESELFGHAKGAFTGAVREREGRFEEADGGTIFLDEIGDLPQDIQVKLLRVLQEGEFERVGSSRTKKVDVRVIAATHQDLEKAVAEGRFRADLYYRLSVYPIHLPSLQARVDDIPRLVWFFIHRHQRDLGRNITKVPQSLMDALQRYAWPGNVRELENVVERALIASEGETLRLDAPLAIGPRSRELAGTPENLDAVQRRHIESVLERCDWRINGRGNSAERLGLHPNTLRFRMKKLGVLVPPGRAHRTRPAATRPPD